MIDGSPLEAGFFDRPVLAVAPELLGCVVEHGSVAVRLTEVEAYAGGEDPGSHAFRGRTSRTEVMFGPPGGLYVYFTYGMHYCVNLVCGPVGVAAAVLLRAGEVVAGVEVARERALAGRVPGARVGDRDLARGPARLARALGLGRQHNGLRVGERDSSLRVLAGRPPARVGAGPRVGVSGRGGDGVLFPWRFVAEGEPTVSAYRVASTRRVGARAGRGVSEDGSGPQGAGQAPRR